MNASELDDPDAAVMRVLYHEHAAAFWRYALRLTGDRARAEDVVQETLLRAWQHPEIANDSERSPRAWLFTVARNMIIDERRSSRFRNEMSTLDGRGAPERAGPDEVNSALDRLLIGDALAQLSPQHRAVVWRSYYLGWTTAQIADDLQIAEGTVKSRLHYALRALRHTLQEMGVTWRTEPCGGPVLNPRRHLIKHHLIPQSLTSHRLSKGHRRRHHVDGFAVGRPRPWRQVGWREQVGPRGGHGTGAATPRERAKRERPAV